MNKLKISLVLFTALFINSTLSIASTLSVPHEFQFIAVNGVEVKDGLFSTTSKVELPVGEQKIAVIYNTTVRNDVGDGSTRISSQSIIVTLLVDENKAYQLSPKTKITSLKKAKAFAKNPEIKIENKKGELATFSTLLPKYEDYGVIGNALKEEDKTLMTVSTAATAITTSSVENKDNTAEKMLHHWWDQADSETKKRFIKFTKNE